MRVLVLGGSGFLGRRVVERLVAQGHTVAGTARSDTAASRLRDAGAEPVRADLLVDADIDDAIGGSGAEAIITSVSLGLGIGPHIVAAAQAAEIGRGVFVSTTSIHTKLDSATKPVRQEAERAIRTSHLAWTILRPTMIYGAPDDRNMVRLLRLVARVPAIPLPGGGSGWQQPVHVDDVADAVVTALATPAAVRRAYDIAGPHPLTLAEVVRTAAEAVGRNVHTFAVPLGLMIRAARLYERLGGTLRPEQFERLAEDKVFDITEARRDLGFDPRTLHAGLHAEAQLLR